ncbi:MAG TPA: bifunctional phosphoribosylaminoimidazolecarboxamide formyltransferase/IMP cyclohydrolase [Acidobacteria bacterium]|nr:bifunctional phosphoribosylaminoimidazolecarboxamide formyltransferase/IMP cyclohydrolase [Acidobacteriota bacterium]
MGGTALISVSDKSGLDRLGPGLERLGWTLLSTGGTARALREAGCEVLDAGAYTGFPEILGGRVKTLHPKIFAGILAAPSEEHRAQLEELDIPAIDLVVVNLYPFRETVAREGVTLAEAVEQIDIGGPSLVRAAAKNHARVTVVVDPARYDELLGRLEAGGVDEAYRRELALEAYRHTAAYDAAISAHLPALAGDRLRSTAAVAERLLIADEVPLRYGENPHQWGLLARVPGLGGLASARQLQGKALSYNNLGDTSGAWRLVWDLPGAGVAVIKHANPCGVGLGESMVEAFRRARATDPMSAFGGVVAANRPVDEAFAEAVVEQFAEVVIAPAVDGAAREVFARKKNLRVLECEGPADDPLVFKSMDGGILLQEADRGFDGEEWKVVTKKEPTAGERRALDLNWRVVKHVGSNAIVVGGPDQVLGIGAGQMSRVDAAKIAVAKAQEMGHELDGAVAASDAFFPFPDGVEALAQAGIRAVIQPGGSIRDAKVIEAADAVGTAMVFTGRRHFRH